MYRQSRGEHYRKARPISIRATQKHLAALYSMRDEVAGQMAEADAHRDSELLHQCETRLSLLNKSISQHESDLQAAKLGARQ